MESTTQVIQDIVDGRHDDKIGDLVHVAIERQKLVRAQRAFDVKVRIAKGDIVRIKDDAALRPKYLLGTEWKVEKVNRKTAACVALDEKVKKTRYRGTVRISMSELDVVNSQ
jgi:hypothetical protein